MNSIYGTGIPALVTLQVQDLISQTEKLTQENEMLKLLLLKHGVKFWEELGRGEESK